MSYSRQSRSLGLSEHSWPSVTTTDTDLTTPSLCSDNEYDEGVAEDGLPPTPPRRPPTPPRRSKRQPSEVRMARSPEVDRLPEIIDVIDVDALPDIELVQPQPDAMNAIPPSPLRTAASSEDAFAKRPPSSPIPQATPRKPLPPARTRQRPAATNIHLRDTKPDGTKTSLPRYNPLATISIPSRKKKVKGSPNASRPQAKQTLVIEPLDPASESGHSRRRRTLDDELRRAGDHLWQEDSVDELDTGVLEATGAKDYQGGFLARGGGAGSPIFVGPGYVEGFKESHRPKNRGRQERR